MDGSAEPRHRFGNVAAAQRGVDDCHRYRALDAAQEDRLHLGVVLSILAACSAVAAAASIPKPKCARVEETGARAAMARAAARGLGVSAGSGAGVGSVVGRADIATAACCCTRTACCAVASCPSATRHSHSWSSNAAQHEEDERSPHDQQQLGVLAFRNIAVGQGFRGREKDRGRVSPTHGPLMAEVMAHGSWFMVVDTANVGRTDAPRRTARCTRPSADAAAVLTLRRTYM